MASYLHTQKNPAESTNGHPVTEQYVKDIKNYIDMQMQDMKNYFDKKFNKQAKQTKEIKSGKRNQALNLL